MVDVLKWGYPLQFNNTPPVTRRPTVTSGYKDPLMNQNLEESVRKLLEKRAIEEVHTVTSRGFYNRLFLRPKASGGWRPILDLKPLNPYVAGTKIKQETQDQIRASLQPQAWTFSVDLQDAFFHIPIHQSSRRYLRFVFNEKVYQYRALPFGLKTAPWVFTAVLSQLQRMPETRDMEIHMYLDDWIVPTTDFMTGIQQSTRLVSLCDNLGLIVNQEKSDLIPSQVFVHLGVRYNLVTYRVDMTPEKREILRQLASRFLSLQNIPARRWLSLIGFLNSQCKLTEYGRLRVRPIQWCLKRQWRIKSHGLQCPVEVDDETREAVRWWLDETNLDLGAPIRLPEPTVLVQTDASQSGWGGHSASRMCHGQWDTGESRLHINILEMRAVYNTLKELDPPPQSVVMVSTDNTTVMSHINRQGGVKSQDMFRETKRLLEWTESHQLTVLAKHVPGKLNILADQLSRRGQHIQTEWELHQEAAQQLFLRWGQPSVDLFATKLNKKLPVYVSPVPDPEALDVDALSISWEGLNTYAFPPHRVLPQVLHKVGRTTNLRMILVAPLWE